MANESDLFYSDDIQVSSPKYAISIDDFEQPAELHISVITTIITLSLLGNSFIIYFYSRRAKPFKPGYIFILTIAIVDIFASVCISPQFAFLKIFIMLRRAGDRRLRDMFFVMFIFVELFYITLLDCMAIDRFLAVFRPFTYKMSNKRILNMIIGAATLSIVIAVILTLLDSDKHKAVLLKTISGCIIIVLFIILVTAYPAIIIKLAKHRKRVRKVHTSSTESKGASKDITNQNSLAISGTNCLMTNTQPVKWAEAR